MAIGNELYSHCNAQKHETFRLNIGDEGAFAVLSPNKLLGTTFTATPVSAPVTTGMKTGSYQVSNKCKYTMI